MGGGMKGTQKQSTSQSSAPPAWAKPLLERTAADAMKMYSSGQGYNTYRGPTQAEFSPQKLQALNKMMTMTGGGPAVTNEAIFGAGNKQVQQVRDMIANQQIAEQQRKAAEAAAAAAAKKPQQRARYYSTYGQQPRGKEQFQTFGELFNTLQNARGK